MEWAKLKNIILVILLVANAFLLFLVIQRESRSAEYDAVAQRNAVELLEQNGIAFDPALLPADAYPALQMERDQQSERAAVQAVLGNVTELTQGSATVYEGELGSARISRAGEFSIRFEPGLILPDGAEADAYAAGILAQMGMETRQEMRWINGGATEILFLQVWGGAPIFSCQITAQYEGDALLSLTGTRLTGTPTAAAGAPPMTPVTLLVKLRAGINALGDICTEIADLEQGYQLSAGLSDPAALVPVWYVTTDTAAYTLNNLTGQLDRAS